MNWLLLLPAISLALIILLYILIKKAGAPRKLKTLIPYLFALFLVSTTILALESDTMKSIFKPDI
ncbi:MAG TPA: hypothetical protein VK469_19330, partial [Candidatus Kapabacteria bacterium]|nr:hypothetical protein [Candidatus Kapabacteria bacterium]